jgi:hypothetical protein
MDLFYRGYDPNARITSAAKHLSAAAARFAVSIVRSIPNLPDAAWAEFQRLLTVEALWSLCLVLAGWLIATVVGGLIGLAVNGLLIIYGLVELWDQVKGIAGSIQQWATSAYEAQSDADLERAAQHFATALSAGGITVLEVVVTHRVFRSVEGKLRDRYPTPDWLRKQYEEETRKRAAARKPEQKPSLPEQVGKAVEVVASGSRGEGMRKVASEFPTTAVVIGGVVVGVGTVAALAWAVSTDGKKVRP